MSSYYSWFSSCLNHLFFPQHASFKKSSWRISTSWNVAIMAPSLHKVATWTAAPDIFQVSLAHQITCAPSSHDQLTQLISNMLTTWEAKNSVFSNWKGYSKSLKVEKKTACNREIIKKPLMKHPWTINTKPVPGPTKVRMMLDDFSPLVACIFSRIRHLKRIGLVPQFQVVNPTVLFDFNLHGTHIPSR